MRKYLRQFNMGFYTAIMVLICNMALTGALTLLPIPYKFICILPFLAVIAIIIRIISVIKTG